MFQFVHIEINISSEHSELKTLFGLDPKSQNFIDPSPLGLQNGYRECK